MADMVMTECSGRHRLSAVWDLANQQLQQGLYLLRPDFYEEALIFLDRAIALAPNWADAWHHRGEALLHLKRYEEALSSFDHVLQIEPNRHDTLAFRNTLQALLNRKVA